jgi:general secretion pathway protein A
MYNQFYGLREKPFALSPDPRFLYLSDSHREALAHLLYGIEQGEGFIAITGEVGTGKTTLCRTLLQRLDPGTEVAFIFNPQLSGLELLQAINAELGLPVEERSRRDLTDQLNRFLLAKKREDRRVLLIIDEAQALERDALEQVRLLSNLETETEKLIQIVLIGQPELDATLESPDLRQLRQRISVRWRLTPLSAAETREYVRHRLRIAAGAPRELFSELALREIHRRSGGIPRLVNRLSDRALLAGYASGAATIGLGLVTQTDQELGATVRDAPDGTGLPRVRHALRRWIGAAALLLAALGAAGWLALRHGAGPEPAPRARDAVPAAHAAAAPEAVVLPPAAAPLPAVAAAPPARVARDAAVPALALAGAVAEAPAPAPVADALPEPPPVDLATALARTSPAATTASSLDAVLGLWGREPVQAELLSLAQALAALRGQGLATLALEGASPDDLLALDLPALLVLRAFDEAPRTALLREVTPEGRAVLVGIGPEPMRVPFDELMRHWDGAAYVPWRDFETLPPVLGPGAEGEPVAWLQRSLASLGHYPGAPSGRFDELTIGAVRALQQDRALQIDGTVGPETKIRLYQELDGYTVPRLGARGDAS